MERPESFAGLVSDSSVDDISNTPRATSDRPSLWLRTGIMLAWAISLSLASLAVLRLTYHDGRHPLIWINAFTRYAYLPAYACLVFGLWYRRRWLAITNLAIVGC